MTVKAFKGTVHVFMLKDKERKVVDPRTIPHDIRDALCVRHNYNLPSLIGPNHDVAHFDLNRQDWRDMRYAKKVKSFFDQTITFNGDRWQWAS
jgi:hypothetical protein